MVKLRQRCRPGCFRMGGTVRRKEIRVAVPAREEWLRHDWKTWNNDGVSLNLTCSRASLA